MRKQDQWPVRIFPKTDRQLGKTVNPIMHVNNWRWKIGQVEKQQVEKEKAEVARLSKDLADIKAKLRKL